VAVAFVVEADVLQRQGDDPMTTITGANHRDGRVRDDSKSATPVASIIVAALAPGDTVDLGASARQEGV
jgi:hypothetical protein